MPNHCYNRVTLYPAGSDTPKAIADIEKIKGFFEDENTFNHIIPEPDWLNIPLMSSDNRFTKYGNDGELPIIQQDRYGESRRFQSTGIADQRWYDWRVQNWDTKWDAYDVEVTDDDPENMEITFNTAWSPPEAICHALREQYPDLSVSWFYDEPGCEIAGYL